MKRGGLAALALVIASSAHAQLPASATATRQYSFDERFLAFVATLSAAQGMGISVYKIKDAGGAKGENTPMRAVATAQRDFFQQAADLALALPPRPSDSTIDPGLVAARLRQAPGWVRMAEKLRTEACAAG